MSKSRQVAGCIERGCDLPKLLPRHRCAWHQLALLPIGEQVEAARARLAQAPDSARVSRLHASAWAPGTRWCAGCQTLVPTWYARGSRCRACASAAQHAGMVKRTYGVDDYDALLAIQGGGCAVCGQRPVSKRLAVDHSHATGEVRGLLCSRHNHDALGGLNDSVELVRNLLHYLEHPPAVEGVWQPPATRADDELEA